MQAGKAADHKDHGDLAAKDRLCGDKDGNGGGDDDIVHFGPALSVVSGNCVAAKRRGVGSAVVQHVIEKARALGLKRLYLETGSFEYFRPARELYRRHGFRECPPFAGYKADPNSTFMLLELG